MPRAIGAAISSGHASYAELDSVLSAEDLYAILEVVAVDRHNARLAHA